MSLRLPNISALALGTLTALTTASPAGAQDVAAQEERATGRITEMFSLRLELALDDLAVATGEPLEAFDDAKAQSREAAAAWLTEHPVKLQHQGPISWNATPIEYEPFAEFLESELWRTARATALTEAQLDILDQRRNERADRARAALGALIQLRVTASLCLTQTENAAVAEICQQAGASLWEKGAIKAFDPYFSNQVPKDSVRDVIDEKALLAVLPPHRRSILAEMLEKGRMGRHGYRLEVEYHLHGRENVEAERELLYGLADALIHRGGTREKSQPHVFAPSKASKHDKDWVAALKATLILDDEAEKVPSRAKKAHVDLRSEYVLAVLDGRAYFTKDQRESLLPLIKELVQNENNRHRDESAPELFSPAELGLDKDGLLIPGDYNRFVQPSTKVRALIETLYEACTPAQQDVLKS